MDTWQAFWNGTNRIYVNDRHQRAHFATIFDKMRLYLPAGPRRTILDWGCGDALAAGPMAEIAGSILLYDGAPVVRARLCDRFGGHPRIVVLDEETLAALAPGSVDLVVLNSVIQYLDRGEFELVLGRIRRLLRPDGALLLGDVIEPGTSMFRDGGQLLRFAASHGFLLAALRGMAATFLSGYRRLRRTRGFSRYSADEVVALLTAHGFSVQRLPRNVSPSRHRRAYLARPCA